MKDPCGRDRGACTKCTECEEYVLPEGGGARCAGCNCTPVDHINLSGRQRDSDEKASNDDSTLETDCTVSSFPPASQCRFPGCCESVHFDMDTGIEFDYCSAHVNCGDITDHLPASGQTSSSQSSPTLSNSSQTDLTSSPVKLCAIPECGQPCYVDPSTGKVHECCGYTHAMEHQRRLNLQQQGGGGVIKGITHCLLPNCDNQVWPFHNYCGRTHADQGMKMGLVAPQPPSQGSLSTAKDSNVCIIPNCSQPKFVESDGKVHPYCGKSHASLARQLGIFPTADKPEDQCEMEGCGRPKLKEGTRVHDYCCRSHADQDAPNRAARLITKENQVKKWLASFSNLKIIRMEDNIHAKPPNGALYKRFQAKAQSLPSNQRKTCLAFHGTSAHNVTSICQNGYDPGRRRGQAYGPGEYFATTPDISMGYCCSAKKMIVNELLLGQNGVHHTQSQNIIVMKDPDHDLPRFIITFQ